MTPTGSWDATAKDDANERFKNSFGSWLWGGMIAATVLHFALFAYFPSMAVADFSHSPAEIEAIELPPDIVIPPPPQQIARPATPIASSVPIDEDITISPTTFEANPVTEIGPPPEAVEVDISEQPVFTPYTAPPKLVNDREVQDALEAAYPPVLREAGIGGLAIVWFFIDETGTVRDTRVFESSGYDDLDQAALSAAGVMRFTPAQNMDDKVPVWIQIPIQFSPSLR